MTYLSFCGYFEISGSGGEESGPGEWASKSSRFPCRWRPASPGLLSASLQGIFHFLLFLLQHQKMGVGWGARGRLVCQTQGSPGTCSGQELGSNPGREACGKFGSASAFRAPDSGPVCVGLPSLRGLTVPTCGRWAEPVGEAVSEPLERAASCVGHCHKLFHASSLYQLALR